MNSDEPCLECRDRWLRIQRLENSLRIFTEEKRLPVATAVLQGLLADASRFRVRDGISGFSDVSADLAKAALMLADDLISAASTIAGEDGKK